MEKAKSTIKIFSSKCEQTDDGYFGLIEVYGATVKIKYKNVVTSIAEADVEISITPYESVETKAFRYHLKAKSDSNKELLARQLKAMFSEYSNDWILIVNEAVVIFLEALSNHKQAFKLSEVETETKGYLIEPFLTEHCINVFFGMGSAGKTLLSLFLSLYYGQGKKLWGGVGKKGKVLLVDFENDQAEWYDKMKSMLSQQGMTMEEADEAFGYWESEQIPLYDQVEKLKRYIRENKISLVIVDSASMAAGQSTSDEAAALKLMAALKMLDTTILLIAHQKKNEGEDNPIGSIQYFNQARNIWHIEGKPDEANDKILHIGCSHKKNNNGLKRKNPIGFRVIFEQGAVEVHLEDAINNFDEKFTISDRILKLLEPGGLTQKQIAETLDKKDGIIRTTLNRLKSKGLLFKLEDIWSINRRA